MHAWAHVYFFTALAALFLEQAESVGARLSVLFRLILLGLTIEFLQTRLHWSAIEVPDLGSDLAGLVFGLLIASLRTAARTSPAILDITKP